MSATCISPFGPRRRGFTLIETMMAAALGAIVVLACIAMFGAMDRTESATARRYDETTSMARLHLVMNRVFSDLWIQGVDAGGAAASSTAGGRTTATSDFAKADAARNGQAQAEPRPRVWLELDQSDQVKAAMKVAGMDTAGSPPQRLEVVTSKAPIPGNFSSASTIELQTALDEAGTMAARGVFELRPDAVTPRERMNPDEKLSGDGKGWTLWWRPLPPNEGMATPDPYTMDPTQDPNAVRVAVGLVECNWQVFKTVMDTSTNKSKGREKVPTMSATQLQDLPAYVEMRATTASGLSANWMFEVGWGYGPETTQEAEQAGATTADLGGAAGGNPQFGGSPGIPGGGTGPGFTAVAGSDGRTTTIDRDGNVRVIGPGRPGQGRGSDGAGGRGPGGQQGGGGRKGG